MAKHEDFVTWDELVNKMTGPVQQVLASAINAVESYNRWLSIKASYGNNLQTMADTMPDVPGTTSAEKLSYIQELEAMINAGFHIYHFGENTGSASANTHFNFIRKFLLG